MGNGGNLKGYEEAITALITELIYQELRKGIIQVGSGRGTVGGAVASDTKGTWFESNYEHFYQEQSPINS